MNAYLEMTKRHQDEVNAFPIIFAFRKERLVEGMRRLGLGPADMDQICALGGGGYIRKSDKAVYN